MEEKRKMKIAFYTLGCKVNRYETEALKEKFANEGYQVVGEMDFANIYIINTCTVTNMADRKSRQYIRKMKRINPESLIAVTGCYAQVSPEEVAAIEGVDLVAGTNEKSNLPKYIAEKLIKLENKVASLEKSELEAEEKLKNIHVKALEDLYEYEETGIVASMESRTRAFIKIQEGCNRFCSYCIIPYARGRVRSRKPQEVIKEVKNFIDNGFKEVVLTGINTALYGKEEGSSCNMEELIGKLNELEGDFRIRLSSLEPTVVNREYVKSLFKYNKLCHHLHLSVQSGSDRIIKLMNRNYTMKEYMEIVDELKGFDPCYGITTDIIVGFPGETEVDFRNSLEAVSNAGFGKVHVFKYSKRKGTKAAEMKEQIAPEVKDKRAVRLAERGKEAANEFFLLNVGTENRVLVEEIEKIDKTNNGSIEFYTGYTGNYIKTYIEPVDGERHINQFVTVRLTKPFRDGMRGVLINEETK